MTKNELKYYQKLKQKKYRESDNKFLIEGIHLTEECLRSEAYRGSIEKVLVTKDLDKAGLLNEIRSSNIDTEVIDEQSLNLLSETVNPQGVIAVVRKPEGFHAKKRKASGITVALDTVNDPGNLGTIIRTCDCFGADKILISGNSVDLYNSKVIRATQGALFKIEIRYDLDLTAELDALHKKGSSIILTDLNSKTFLNEYKPGRNKDHVLVFGNEAGGISGNILSNKNYIRLKIKLFSDCDSLNLSVSAGIVLNHFMNSSGK